MASQACSYAIAEIQLVFCAAFDLDKRDIQRKRVRQREIERDRDTHRDRVRGREIEAATER